MPFASSKATSKFTVFALLQVKGIPRGSTLKVVCKAPKGKKCASKRVHQEELQADRVR